MKVKEIIELIDFISKKRIDEVKVETSEIKLAIKKSAAGPKVIEQIAAPVQQIAAPVAAPAPAATPAAAPSAPATPAAPAEKAANNDNLIAIKSPMVGTFYRTANPDAPEFVKVGDTVAPGKAVCIIEAMKLFNEIESEISGKIVEVLVENSTPVEYDQPLFLVDPS